MDSWAAYLSLAVTYGLTLVAIRWVLLTHKRQPAASTAWILAIILLPILGGVLFLFFGINRVERRKASKAAASRITIGNLADLRIKSHEISQHFTETQRRLARLAEQTAAARPTPGNSIELLIDTNVAVRRMEEAIMAAKESIHLEFYIWKPDKIGLRIRDLLIERARAGVKVRFLYDSLGSMLLRRAFLDPMREAGISVAPFLPGQTLRERWSINLRSHRKIIVVDGRVGFTGGMNIGDEYLGRNKHLGYWRDTHMRMVGPSVLQLQQIFAEDWYYATAEDLSCPELFPPPPLDGPLMAQVINGGPVSEVNPFHALFFAAICEARERVTLATSFFVPTEALVVALETAASKGVDVRLLVPRKSEWPWTVRAGRSYYDTLLKCGVKIFEYRRGILHSKTMTIDGNWSFVGSPNFDSRSLILNFEVGVAVFDESFAQELESHFEADREHAREIQLERWLKRPLRHVLIENMCRLFSPVM